jgi:phosphate transport system permease protein
MASHASRPVERRRRGAEESIWIQLARRGDPFVWLTGGALATAAVMILGMLALILANGLGAMWPKSLVRLQLAGGQTRMGELERREAVPLYVDPAGGERLLIRTGNRDVTGSDFEWVSGKEIAATGEPADATVLERLEYGPFYGFIDGLRTPAGTAEGPAAWRALRLELRAAAQRREAMRRLESREIAEVNEAIEKARLAIRRISLRGKAGTPAGAARIRELEEEVERDRAASEKLLERLREMRRADGTYEILLRTVDGRTLTQPVSSVVRAYRPNELGPIGRLNVYRARIWEFLTAEPRESNTAGGIFPAIFGTVLMTLVMTIAVVPLGVLAALYLREYAKQGPLVSAVRIAVNNLAGVPSIVFGLFGLGFFGYLVGGTIDQAFFGERLPAPTFGGGGLLWASLTLALLTVPVVIVATEEALAAVPMGLRDGSMACGASKFQTITRIVLPSAAPGIMTGAILAMARGAGEVAPLMITGVVKLAPKLPLDGEFPFLHLERKFMHLGFHIYDVGFQSPNVEAAKPMVYATALLLLAVVVLLNLAAIIVRTKLRDRYKTGAFG